MIKNYGTTSSDHVLELLGVLPPSSWWNNWILIFLSFNVTQLMYASERMLLEGGRASSRVEAEEIIAMKVPA